jgi:hypothetical protein
MPGDERVPLPKMTSTRAIIIDAPPEDVWAWLVQIGQAAAASTASTRWRTCCAATFTAPTGIIPQFQELHTGDLILLAPAEAPCYRVATVEPPRVMVLAGADPKTWAVNPLPARPDEMATTWQWMLRPLDGGRGTRLVARQRYSYPRRQSVLWHLVEPPGFVMERRMLGGIKARAEAHHLAALST